MSKPSKIVVLDRDGVINKDSSDYIKSPSEWRPIPGALEAIAKLQRSGFLIAVASNQSGLGRGLFDLETLGAIHKKLQHCLIEKGGKEVPIFFCPHRPDEGCACRKPGTGLLRQIAKHYELDLVGAPFVGDSIKDLQAAADFSMRGILVRSGKGRASEAQLGRAGLTRVSVFEDLAAVAATLVERSDD